MEWTLYYMTTAHLTTADPLNFGCSWTTQMNNVRMDVEKAASYFDLTIVHVPLRPDYCVDMKAYREVSISYQTSSACTWSANFLLFSLSFSLSPPLVLLSSLPLICSSPPFLISLSPLSLFSPSLHSGRHPLHYPPGGLSTRVLLWYSGPSGGGIPDCSGVRPTHACGFLHWRIHVTMVTTCPHPN